MDTPDGLFTQPLGAVLMPVYDLGGRLRWPYRSFNGSVNWSSRPEEPDIECLNHATLRRCIPEPSLSFPS